MTDPDIEKIRKVLSFRKRPDLAELLKYSTSVVNETGTFGKYLYSIISYFEIHSPLENHEKLKKLSREDKKTVLDAVLEVYPHRDNSPEIEGIFFYLNVDLEPTHNTIQTRTLKETSFGYIHEQIGKCDEKIERKDFEGAITNARALVEAVCLQMLEDSGASYEYEGNLVKLAKETFKLLKMGPELYEEDSLKQVVSGCGSIIQGLSNIRNVMGDAHGKSNAKRYKVSHRHALLAVNISKGISEFLWASWKSRAMQLENVIK